MKANFTRISKKQSFGKWRPNSGLFFCFGGLWVDKQTFSQRNRLFNSATILVGSHPVSITGLASQMSPAHSKISKRSSPLCNKVLSRFPDGARQEVSQPAETKPAAPEASHQGVHSLHLFTISAYQNHTLLSLTFASHAFYSLLWLVSFYFIA